MICEIKYNNLILYFTAMGLITQSSKAGQFIKFNFEKQTKL
jgi:hypothetical protein